MPFFEGDSGAKPFGNSPETVILGWNRPGTVQKPCFWGETVRERFGNRVGTPRGAQKGRQTIFLLLARENQRRKQGHVPPSDLVRGGGDARQTI